MALPVETMNRDDLKAALKTIGGLDGATGLARSGAV